MKAILIPVEQHTSRAVLGTALVIARAFDSYVEGIATGPNVPDVIVPDVGILPKLDPPNRREWATKAFQHFEALMTAHSVPPVPRSLKGFAMAGTVMSSSKMMPSAVMVAPSISS
jgi:hypothetical protein